jgi:hypothetical protein
MEKRWTEYDHKQEVKLQGLVQVPFDAIDGTTIERQEISTSKTLRWKDTFIELKHPHVHKKPSKKIISTGQN